VAGLFVGALVLAACGLEQKKQTTVDADEQSEMGAHHLGDLSEDGSIWNSLNDNERTAVQRSGMSGVHEHADPNDDEQDAWDQAVNESKGDKAAKMGMSFLVVAVSLGAAAAPFLLF